MKNITAILTLLILSSFTSQYNTNGEIIPVVSKIERDKQLNLNAKILMDKLYINLKMLNESETGVYLIIRKFPDGTIEYVDSRQMLENTINTPILYSFIEKCLPTQNVEYILYRDALESNIVQKWEYNSKLNLLEEVYANQDYEFTNLVTQALN
jgi:hypothetical protein